jgi:hypothetical protein
MLDTYQRAQIVARAILASLAECLPIPYSQGRVQMTYREGRYSEVNLGEEMF